MDKRKKINIAFKVDEELYLSYKAALLAWNIAQHTRINVTQELTAHMAAVIASGIPERLEKEEES